MIQRRRQRRHTQRSRRRQRRRTLRRRRITRQRRRTLRRRRITRRTPLKYRGGGAPGSTALPSDYPEMTVVAKMPSGEKDDVDSLFTVMSPTAYKELAGASADDSVPS